MPIARARLGTVAPTASASQPWSSPSATSDAIASSRRPVEIEADERVECEQHDPGDCADGEHLEPDGGALRQHRVPPAQRVGEDELDLPASSSAIARAPADGEHKDEERERGRRLRRGPGPDVMLAPLSRPKSDLGRPGSSR